METTLHIIRDVDAYERYLAEYEKYFDDEPAPGSEAAERFELLGLLLSRYEEEHVPAANITPVDAIRFAMDRLGLEQSDLAALLGSRSRASEILSGRRDLTLAQIRTLCREWRIPAETLVGVEVRASA